MNNANKKSYELRIDLEHAHYFLGYAGTVERGVGSSAYDALDDLDFHSNVDCDELTEALKDHQGSNDECIQYTFHVKLDADGGVENISVDVDACLAAEVRAEPVIDESGDELYITTWSTIDRDDRLPRSVIDAIDDEIQNSEYHFYASLVEV